MTYVVTTEGECYSAEIMSVGRQLYYIVAQKTTKRIISNASYTNGLTAC